MDLSTKDTLKESTRQPFLKLSWLSQRARKRRKLIARPFSLA